MNAGPALRKAVFTAHVVASVGWVGAVFAFLGVAVVALATGDAATARGAYLVMEPAAWFVLVPLAFASLVTGVVQALTTTWRLFHHYWVVSKLLINVVATVVLLAYMETFGSMADVAANPASRLDMVQNASPVVHAAGALVLLLAATLLAVFKPRGLTPYGRRKRRV
jgi:hypothetical protein